ncbi:sensor histidine kinase [Streptomyces sp. NPDC004609]|uniref:sensor histidine kinase n=1 Tax=Streptomyces sp. NPDC004609 TaxID=3364704 RepID=UPI0036AB50D9
MTDAHGPATTGATRGRAPDGHATGKSPDEHEAGGAAGVRKPGEAPGPRACGSAPGPATALAALRWGQFVRYGPFAVLALATLVSAAAHNLMNRTETYAAGVLVVLAVVLQLWWHGPSRPEAAPADEPASAHRKRPVAGQVYYWLRSVIALGLSWANPFFCIYAVIGFYDASHLLSGRWIRGGLLFTAVVMAGSQSGGLPPRTLMNWALFGALFALNASLCLLFAHIGDHEEEAARQKAATMDELERTNARLEQALEENAHLHTQLLVQAREAGVADERRRLAAEIHDTIAQGLAGIIAQLQVVAAAGDERLAREHLARAAALARSSLGEARRSVQNLSPAALEHDTLSEALEKTAAEWSERHRVPARFTVTGTEEPLHDEVAATLLRIGQEALSNVARHARAARVGVTLSYMGDEVTLDIRDDGRGFDPLALPPPSGDGGFGLRGMRARAERVAGSLEVEAEPGGGTVVSARVPLVRHGYAE